MQLGFFASPLWERRPVQPAPGGSPTCAGLGCQPHYPDSKVMRHQADAAHRADVALWGKHAWVPLGQRW